MMAPTNGRGWTHGSKDVAAGGRMEDPAWGDRCDGAGGEQRGTWHGILYKHPLCGDHLHTLGMQARNFTMTCHMHQ